MDVVIYYGEEKQIHTNNYYDPFVCGCGVLHFMVKNAAVLR